jgi:formylglycine-generating enzyme required for sulfatase activity
LPFFRPVLLHERLQALLLVLLVAIAGGVAPAVEPPQPSPPVLRNSINMPLVRLPAGQFLMGGQEPEAELLAAFPDTDRQPGYFHDEYPQHAVRISRPLLIGQYEVTVGQFRQFADASGYKTQAESDGEGGWGYDAASGKCVGRRPQFTWRDPGFAQSDEHPVVNVSWNDAVAFCNWLSRKEGKRYRLPSEAEWEYACRAGTSARYFHGNDPNLLQRYAHLINTGNEKFAHIQHQVHALKAGESLTAKVGSRQPNAWGLYDTLGNVWEWTNDWQSDDYYATSPAVDPPGPGSGDVRIRRGGAWNSFPMYARCAFRNLDYPDTRCVNIGFRVVCDE